MMRVDVHSSRYDALHYDMDLRRRFVGVMELCGKPAKTPAVVHDDGTIVISNNDERQHATEATQKEE
jgi:hypothetical protein